MQLELKKARDGGTNKKDFYKPGKGQKNSFPLKSKTGKLITMDEG